MKKAEFSILITVLLFVAVSCGKNTVSRALTETEKIVSEAEKKKNTLTAEEWGEMNKKMEDQMRIINQALEDNHLKLTDRLKFLEIVARWTTVATEIGMKEIETHTGKVMEELMKASDSIPNDSLSEFIFK
jgi:hypothetical protein